METDVYMKMLLGANAIHTPFRAIIQDQGEGVVSFVGAIRNTKLRFGSEMVHQFVAGDMMFRPRIVAESNHLKGVGLAGIVTSSAFFDIQEWIDNGNIILKI